MQWEKLDELWLSAEQPRMYGPTDYTTPLPWNAVYERHNVVDSYGNPPDQWHTVDLTPFGVAPDATFAFLAGILIITHGTAQEVAEVRVTFRRPGDDDADISKYIGQTIEGNVGGGQRSNMATWVPLKAGKFEYSYHMNTGGVWPANSSCGINLSVQAWGR